MTWLTTATNTTYTSPRLMIATNTTYTSPIQIAPSPIHVAQPSELDLLNERIDCICSAGRKALGA